MKTKVDYIVNDSLGPSRDEKRSSRTSHARLTLTFAPSSRADHRAQAAFTSAITQRVGCSHNGACSRFTSLLWWLCCVSPAPRFEWFSLNSVDRSKVGSPHRGSTARFSSGNARRRVQCAMLVCFAGAAGKAS